MRTVDDRVDVVNVAEITPLFLDGEFKRPLERWKTGIMAGVFNNNRRDELMNVALIPISIDTVGSEVEKTHALANDRCIDEA